MTVGALSDLSAAVTIVALRLESTLVVEVSDVLAFAIISGIGVSTDAEWMSLSGTVVVFRVARDALCHVGVRRDTEADAKAVEWPEGTGIGANSGANALATEMSNFEIVALASSREESVPSGCSAISSASTTSSDRG